jgi:LmbE family N-acetylglucosaminyl deacetylase
MAIRNSRRICSFVTVICIASRNRRMSVMPLPDAMQRHADHRSTYQPAVRHTSSQRFVEYAEIVTIHAQPFQDCAVPHSYHERHENPERNRFAHGR